jgi:hypothetical protein
MRYISSFVNEARERRRASLVEARFIQDLQRGILDPVSLADPYSAVPLITRNKDPNALISVQNYYCRKFRGFLVFSHTLLPRDRHPLLNRLYVPSQTFLSEQKLTVPTDQRVAEQARWIGFDVKDFVFRNSEDFFTLFKEMLGKQETLAKPGGLIVTAYPHRLNLPRRSFLMEMRGYFRDDDDLIAAAKLHIDIVEKLVTLDYLVLEDDIIARPGWRQSEELDFRVLYTPPN